MNRLILPRRQRRIPRPPVSRSPSPSQEISEEQQQAALQATAVLPEQSLALVQIFLNAAIASILYVRQILKHDSSVFSERCVADLLGASGAVTYKDFLDLENRTEEISTQTFKVLTKGRSQRADKILTLLEGGIFVALQTGYLEAIQLSISADSSRPSDIVECYTFTITHTSSSGQTGRNVSSISVSPDPQTAFFVGDAQKSFNTAIKGLLRLIRDLPKLPRRRNLGLNLFYTDDCPASFEPLGFTGSIDDHLSFPGDQGLARKSEEGSILVAGAHRIGVVLSHVASADGEERLHVIPKDVNYSLKRSRLDEYMHSTEVAASPNVASSSQPFQVSSQPLPATDIIASPAAPSTQTRDDITTRDALQQMQRSSSRAGELIPTQTLVDADDLDSDDSGLPDQSFPNDLHSHQQAGRRPQRVILRTKVAELIIHVRAVQERCPTSGRIFDQRALDSCKIKRKVKPAMVNCECMDNKSHGEMLLCEVCGTWQHQSCYGWDEVEEIYRPIEHFCYSCLLLPKEKDLNNWMPILVECRNTLSYLYKCGFPTGDDLSGLMEAMHFDDNQKDVYNSKVMQILAKHQFIDLSDGAKIVESKRQQGILEFVDPLACIFHLYQDRDDPKTRRRFKTSDALKPIEQTYAGFALDNIRTHDSRGQVVIRYGYYPRLAALQSRKRSASAVEDSQDAGAGGEGEGEGVGSSSKVPRLRKMSRSELVCFDTTSSETHPESALESDDDDMYN